MTISIAVLGASGVYGRHLLPRLIARGHNVRALVRSPHTAHAARASGADIVAADIFAEDGLAKALDGCDLAINLATALGNTNAGVDYALNDRVRREGVPIFLRACVEAGITRVIQQSIALTHSAGEDWADENDGPPRSADPISAAAIDAACAIKEMVARAPLDWVTLSGGLFYGPGTGFDDDWFARAAAGKLRLPGDGADYVSLIHIADMAEATCAAIDRWPSRQELIIADDAPARWRDVFAFIAASMGAPPPAPGGRQGFPSWRVRNRRARDMLKWKPFCPDFRAGLAR